jgi:hypothetical protein
MHGVDEKCVSSWLLLRLQVRIKVMSCVCILLILWLYECYAGHLPLCEVFFICMTFRGVRYTIPPSSGDWLSLNCKFTGRFITYYFNICDMHDVSGAGSSPIFRFFNTGLVFKAYRVRSLP